MVKCMCMGSVKTPSEMITPEEMAPRCGMCPENIRKALRRGIFPAGFGMKMGSGQWRYYIPRAEFEGWLAGEVPSRWCTALIDNTSRGA